MRLIDTGALEPGSPLPTEQELATLCRTSQPTVNREMRRLLNEGVVSVDSDGVRIVNGGRTGLLGRTVAVFTAFGVSQLPVPEKALPAWEINLEFVAESRLMEDRWRVWRLPAGDLSDAELLQIARTPPAGALVFADALGRATAMRVLAALDQAGTHAIIHGGAEEYPNRDTVQSDQAYGAAAVARWLGERGCRLLVASSHLFADGEPSWYSTRRRGYRRGAQEAGLPPPEELLQPAGIVEPDGDVGRFRANAQLLADALRRWKNSPRPLGILALTDGEVPLIWAACRILGLRPGRDVLVAGYDGYWGDLMERGWEGEAPSVSTDKRHAEMGTAMADLLKKRIAGSAPRDPCHVLIEPRIIPGGSYDGVSHRME